MKGDRGMAENSSTIAQRTDTTNLETTRSDKFFAPRVDIFEGENELVLCADMPGVAPGDVDLRYEQGELILQGRSRPSARSGHLILGEFEEGDYYRVFQIHESIDSSRIEA